MPIGDPWDGFFLLHFHTHDRVLYITEVDTMNLDLGPYCLQYRPTKYILSSRESR